MLIALELPSGALPGGLGRRRVLLVGAGLTASSLAAFAVAQIVPAFMALGALSGGALVSIADPSSVADGAFAG